MFIFLESHCKSTQLQVLVDARNFFIPPSLNEEVYLQLFEDTFDPIFTEIIENDDSVIFQDGASPHYAELVLNL